MRNVRPLWLVRANESPRHAYFISHVGEDLEDVRTLKSEIERKSGRGGRSRLDVFLDADNWQTGNENNDVIRDRIWDSEHLLVWVTPAYLANRRGWIWVELALGQLIETSRNWNRRSPRHYTVICVFRGVTLESVERTPLLEYWQRSLNAHHMNESIGEIADKAVDFHFQEADRKKHR